MAVTNKNGHGVSSLGGVHHTDVVGANVQFPAGANWTDSMKKSSDATGPYKAPMGSKKKFPAAR